MTWSRAVVACLLVAAVCDLSQALMLERLPRHIPRQHKNHDPQDSGEDDDFPDAIDATVEKKRIVKDPNHLAPLAMKPTWKAIYPLTQSDSKRTHRKRDVQLDGTSDQDRNELSSILQDDQEQDDQPEEETKKRFSGKREIRTIKKKRQSEQEASEPGDKEVQESNHAVDSAANTDFQDWLRQEYYRNMAKSFASMRKKRESPHASKFRGSKRQKKSPGGASFSEITDNLRAIEDQLFQDALQTMREGTDEDEDDATRQNRISNDLSLAYDLETMRNAFFRLRDTLASMERDNEDEDMYRIARKRSVDCPALDQLTSDCSTLSDIMPDGPIRRILRRACNWHEVCYTCGKMYGLTSENCDGSFIEQTQTICQGDAPCESSASLLVVPLRQRRVFYKRSNPDVCVDEPCVEAFLREGLAALDEGRAFAHP